MKNLFSWVEIPATDMNRAVKFYGKVLNLKLEAMDWGSEKMAFFPGDGGAISEAPGFKPAENGVLVHIHAGNELDAMLDRIREAGGQIIRPKTKIEAEGRGYFALFKDSEGNRLGVYGDR